MFAEMNGKVVIQSGTVFKINCIFPLNMSIMPVGEK